MTTDPLTTTPDTGCPACGAARLPEEQFCEACGASLPPSPSAAGPPTTEDPGDGVPAPGVASGAGITCLSCGTVDQFADGYCAVCGMREPRPRDHEERDGDGWAGVSDRGRRHHRNEDAFAAATLPDGRLILAVSDGVSTTQRPDDASAAAVAAAVDILAASPSAAEELPFAAAMAAARDAVVALGHREDPQLGPPSCTLLLAVVGDRVDLAGLGDCRAYWVQDGRAEQVTVDDSWATEQLEAGTMTAEQVWADRRAHVITRWLGVDGDPAWQPRLWTLSPDGPGWLVACSDGLWNYLGDAEALIAAIAGRSDKAETARALIEHANTSGGHDNITVVVADWPRAASAPAAATTSAPEGESGP